MTEQVQPVSKVLHRLREIARVTIELTAPLSISTGDAGDAADNALVRDANDLPAIPGTSIAGMLRARQEKPRAKAMFGFQDKAPDDESSPPAQRSLVRVSWGMIHDSTDAPVEDLRTPQAIAADPVLGAALGPVVRDHVRIDHRGTVDGDGKYTRASVMVGHRFTFELETSGAAATAWMDTLIDQLCHPDTRLGGRTRAGLGAFKVRRIHRRRFDLAQATDLDAWITRPLALAADIGGQAIDVSPVHQTWQRVRLVPTEPWQIGGGDGAGIEPGRLVGAGPESAPDIVPYTERRIEWSEERGWLGDPQLVLPASAIKGALRHRTAFHLRVAEGDFAHAESPDRRWRDAHLPGLTALFGAINEKDGGHRGHVIIDDVRIPISDQLLATTHVSLDRFTGAPLRGHLFEEVSVDDQTPLYVEIQVGRCEVEGAVADAFEKAVEDLCTERLQLGAGAGRGYGWFKATPPPAGWVRRAVQGGT